jgi:hypothetical protein
MPTPLANRMTHFEIHCDLDDWKDWAIPNNIHPLVIGFLNLRENLLNKFDTSSDEQAFPTPRSWEFVSEFLYACKGDVDRAYPLISGTVGDGVAVEFKAFLITDAITAGLDEESIKEGIKDGWSGLDFIMQADGTLKGRHCSAGEYRHDCVGQLFGGSAYTNQFGQTSVGFITPNMPGARIAIAMRTPERSLASNKIQYLQLNVMTNEEFANSNLEPLDASFSIIPFLVNRDGQNVIKAGTTFSLLLSIPEIPNTEVGKGFSFYVETKNVGDEVDGVDVIVPGGVDGADLSCEFLNGFCIVPGGPFKVLKPTTLTISARPTSSSFPVKPTSLEIGVIDSDTLK